MLHKNASAAVTLDENASSATVYNIKAENEAPETLTLQETEHPISGTPPLIVKGETAAAENVGEEDGDIELFFNRGTESLARQIEDIPPLDNEASFLALVSLLAQKLPEGKHESSMTSQKERRLDASVPVCTFVPRINLYGAAACLSFLVDLWIVPVSDISADNLGQWNTREGRRMSVKKFYQRAKVGEGSDEKEREYCVVRRRYLHPHCFPNNSIRKVIWLVKKDEVYCRYAVISYYIEADAHVISLLRGNIHDNQDGRASDGAREKHGIGLKSTCGAHIDDGLSTSRSCALSEETVHELDNEEVLETVDSTDENSLIDVDDVADSQALNPTVPEFDVSDGCA
ncbi:unnamed protein product [Gongylonema pulchrum]|uniref:Uncharacterized protein n=1 Tax=Gongylonema pulchrum TaxID=637853 RepID=A0A183EBU9_9BILA|nr:unnamed protein product [Gongylonema pulchrum]